MCLLCHETSDSLAAWVRTRITFLILRATNSYLRGSRKNGGLRLVGMIVRVYPLVRIKISDICVHTCCIYNYKYIIIIKYIYNII